MKILGVDTSSQIGTVGIVDQNRVLGEYTLELKMKQAERLLPMIDELLRAVQIEPPELDGLGVATGPGFFTALRIGITTVKTLAQTLQLPICGINTLDGLAAQVFEAEMILAGTDAGRGQIFAALYKRKQDELIRLSEYRLFFPGELFSLDPVVREAARITVVGSIPESCKEEIASLLEDRRVETSFLPPYLGHRGSVIAAMAGEKLNVRGADDLFELKPFYLRPSDAQAEVNKSVSREANSED